VSSRPGPGQCRVVRARADADVELSELGLMSSGPGASRDRVLRGRAEVESSGAGSGSCEPRSMSSRPGSG